MRFGYVRVQGGWVDERSSDWESEMMYLQRQNEVTQATSSKELMNLTEF